MEYPQRRKCKTETQITAMLLGAAMIIKKKLEGDLEPQEDCAT
jgi:hypothetical protein